MDGNKDEALKCLRIGKEALDSGDRSRAMKFLTKARRLDPSLPIDDLLSAAEQSNPNPTSSIPTEPRDPSSSEARVRASKSTSSKDYTEEQVTIVRQIRSQKDYYKILGLEKTCSVEDVRKAYRKLSLRVHPDKNKAPGSEEAFKAVSKAFQCLSDEESRKRYDLVGSDEPNYDQAPAQRHSHQGFNGFYGDDFDPDEIFRNFFGGGGGGYAATPFGNFQFRTGGMGMPTGNGGSGGFNVRMLAQILPILIILLLNFLPWSDPIYVLSRSQGYGHKLETARGVPYFVKSVGFEREYPYGSNERVALEKRVEREYVSLLSQNCRVEIQRRQWGLAYDMPHCDMLEKFQAVA